MRMVICFMLRCLLLLPEEWGKAKTDMHTAQAVHAVESTLGAELTMFRKSIASLKELEREAAKAMAESPASAEIIVSMLRERMESLRTSVHKAAEREAA